MTNINQNFNFQCDKCDKNIVINLSCTDDSVFQSIIIVIKQIRIICEACSQCAVVSVDDNDSRQTHIDKLHLESLKILMSEMVDQRMDAKIEWTHAQNIRALMSTFDLHCDELDSQLNNPNKAVMSNNAMWVVLPYHVCELIRDALTKEMNIPQNKL